MSKLAPYDRLLLRATFGMGEAAREAWARWIATRALDAITPAEYDLLPRLYRKLSEDGVAHSELPRLKGIYRRTWYSNQLHFSEAQAFLRPLASELERVGVTGRNALILAANRTPGLLDAAPFELWLRPADVPLASRILAHLGWRPERALYPGSLNHILTHHHALHFRDPDGKPLLVRWQFAPHTPGDGLAEHTTRIRVQGTPLYLLSPATQFVDLSLRRPRTTVLQRVADAFLLHRLHEIEWGAVAGAAERLHLHFPVSKMMEAMNEALPGTVPATTIERLSAASPLWQRLESNVHFGTGSARARMLYVWAAYHRAEATEPRPARRGGGFLDYCRRRWRLPSVQGVPAFAARTLRERIER